VCRLPGRSSQARHVVRNRGEQHHTIDLSQLRDHRGFATTLGVPADRNARPLRLTVVRQEMRPAFLGEVFGEVLEQLRQPVVDAVRLVDVDDGGSVDSIKNLETCILEARVRVGGAHAIASLTPFGYIKPTT